MKLESFDGIILDIDGTIWNTTGIVAVAWNKAIDKSGFNAKKVNAQILQGEFGKPMDVIARDLWPELTPEQQDILISNCCTEEHIEIRGNTLDLTYPGVVETIRELSSQQNFYIVSNCQDGYIELVLEKTNLTDCIKDFECFGRTRKSKAENILLLASRNGITAPVYVGDTQGDSDACSQAGIPFIWASYGFGKCKNYIEKLETFVDLKKVLEKQL